MVEPSAGPSPYAEDLRLAHVLADGVDSMALERFRAQDLQISTKADQTQVTDVDRAVEDALRSTLSRVRPRDAVLGEEYGESGHGSRRWVIDPIDGTHNFVRGVPVWAVLIALMDGEDAVVGLVAAPGLQRRWWAAQGAGAWTGRSLSAASRCEVSKVCSLRDAFLSYSSLSGWADRYQLENFLHLTRAVSRTRAFGDFWSYMLLAQGGVDIACEPEVSLWDLAAPSVIVTEAGGRFTDLSGVSGPAGGSAAATNGPLHDDVLELLSRDLSDDLLRSADDAAPEESTDAAAEQDSRDARD